MPSLARNISSFAAAFVALGIAIGAFGAHGLKDILDPHGREIFEKGVFYHLLNALGLLMVALFNHVQLLEARWAEKIWWSLSAGIVIFSGTLYLYAITGITTFAMMTPVGGILMILSWGMLAIGLRKP